MFKYQQSNLQNFISALQKSSILDWAKKLQKEFPDSEVYLVGGAVRDAILGVKDNKDFDFVVQGVAMKKLEKFLSALGWVEKLGRNFGVLKFKPEKFINDKNFEPLDIALPRTDFSFNTGGYKDFKIKFDKDLKIEDDLLRRDFTINAIAVILPAFALKRPIDAPCLAGGQAAGRLLFYNSNNIAIIDPYGGLKDLEDKIIRAVGKPEERFREDYSRLLRAIRLSCQLNFEIEQKTFSILKKFISNLNSKNKQGDWITPREILAKEILRAFYYNSIKTFDLCDKSGIFKILMPEVLKMKKCPQPDNFHSEGDVWQHTKLALDKIDSPEFKRFEKKLSKLFGHSGNTNLIKEKLELIFAVIFHDLGKPYTIETPEKNKVDRIRFNGHDNFGAGLAKKICERLNLSAPENYGLDIDNIEKLVRKHMMLIHGHPSEFRPTTVEKYFFSENFPGVNLIKLAYLDSLATIPTTGPLEFDLINALLQRIKAMRSLMKTKKTRALLPAPLLNGDEIMKLLKIKPGKKVGEIKERLREIQLSGRIKNKAEARKYLFNIGVKLEK